MKGMTVHEIAGRHVVRFPRTPSNTSLINFYGGIPRRPDAAENAIVCMTAERADEFVTMAEFQVGHSVTPHRWPILPEADGLITDAAIYYDRYGPDMDDAAMKEAMPPPTGISVSYRWSGQEAMYRLDAHTEKDGKLVTRTVRLHPQERGQMAADIAKAYARFLRTSPAPAIGADTASIGGHGADILGRIGRPAAKAVAAWRADLLKLPIERRGEHRGLRLPPECLVGEIRPTVTLNGINGSNQVAVTLDYDGKVAINQYLISIHADLPETLKSSLTGRRADVVVGDDALRHVTIGRMEKTKPFLQYRHAADVVPFDEPEGVETHEDLAAGFAAIGVQRMRPGVEEVLSKLASEDVLLLVRLAMAGNGIPLRPWTGRTHRLLGDEAQGGILMIDTTRPRTVADMVADRALHGADGTL